MIRLYFLFISLILFITPSPSLATALKVLDLTSPEKTFETFYSAMSDYSKGIATHNKDLEKRILDATDCFEKTKNFTLTLNQKKETAILLKEIIDRTLSPSDFFFQNNHLKGTNIFFKKIDDWYYISSFSLQRAERDFEEIRQNSYKRALYPGAQHRPSFIEKYLPEGRYSFFLGLNQIQWVNLFIAFATALAFFIFLSKSIFFLNLLLFKKDSFSSDIAQALRNPFVIFLTAYLLDYFSANFHFNGNALFLWDGFIKVLYTISIFWVLFCLIVPFEKALARLAAKTKSDLDDQLIPLLGKTVRVLVIILALMTTVQSLGVNVFSLMAGLGVGGLAIALAAKDTAANFFGSLMILFDQPFAKGDWIKVGDTEGTVEDIGFRSTRIRTFYDSQIVVPNSTIANTEIDNLGRRQYRRTRTTLNLTYSTSEEQLKDFIAALKEIIENHSLTRKDKYHVAFNTFGSSSLDVLLYYFISSSDYKEELKAKEEINFSIKKIAQELGVDFAFPSQSLYFENKLDLNEP